MMSALVINHASLVVITTNQYCFPTWVGKSLLLVVCSLVSCNPKWCVLCSKMSVLGLPGTMTHLLCSSRSESHYLRGQYVVITVTYTHCTAKQLLGMWDSCSATFISHFTHLFSPPKYCMMLRLIIFSFAGKGDLQSNSQSEWFTLVIK